MKLTGDMRYYYLFPTDKIDVSTNLKSIKNGVKRIRVKICGITRPEDGASAAIAGADAIGLVFYSPSKRCVTIERANSIIGGLPPFITKVGLFVDASSEYIRSVIKNVNLDLLQFHGEEDQDACMIYSKPFVKAVKMEKGVNILEQIEKYDKAAGILLDTHVSGIAGGTGQTFDWSFIPGEIRKPVILAGGLNPDNVYDAINNVNPYAVDVSGGVESETGVKDKDKIMKFIQNVRALSNE